MAEKDALLMTAERRTTHGDRIRLHDVKIQDDFTNEHLEQVQSEVKYFASLGFYGDAEIDLFRERSGVDMDNPATRAVIECLPGIEKWFKMIPRAIALSNIYDPTSDELHDGTKIGKQTQEWFRNIADAIGIRSRTKVLLDLIKREHACNPDFKVASLACGASQPVLGLLARMLEEKPSSDIQFTLADLDRVSIAMAEETAQTLGITENVRTVTKNLLHMSGIDLSEQGDQDQTTNEQFDVVEALGFLEYLKPDDQKEYNYNGVINERKTRAGAVTFMKHAYDLVRPGGLLVVGNMLDTHPELGLTLNVVQWPHIQPRSIEEMLEILDKGGIGGEAEIDIYCPSDGVYAVYAIRKPAEG